MNDEVTLTNGKFEETLAEKINEIERKYELMKADEIEKLETRMRIKKIAHVIVIEMIERNGVEFQPTFVAYSFYKRTCKIHKWEFMSKIEFSRFILDNFNFKIINTKLKGCKYRVFVKSNYQK